MADKTSQITPQNTSSKPVVIIFSTAYFPLVGGAEVALRELTDRMNDWEFHMYTAKITRGRASEERIGNITVHRVGIGDRIDKWLLPILGPIVAIRRHAKTQVASIWAMMASYGGLAALIYTWFRPRAKLLLTLQEGDSLEHIKRRMGPFQWLFRRLFKRADEIQAISRFLANWAKDMGYPREPVIIPNGVDLARFTPKLSAQERIDLRKSLGYKSDDRILVTTSRLTYKNGIDEVVRALAMFPPHVKFLVMGVGEQEEELKYIAEQMGVAKRITWLGKVSHEDMPRYLEASDIFIRSSRSEGLGNSFLEAMAIGLPIIGTSVGGIPDFLKKGETGVFCQSGDYISIRHAVDSLLEDPILNQKIRGQGQALVQKNYDWNNIAKNQDSLLHSLGKRKSILIAAGIYPPEIGGPASFVPAIAQRLQEEGMYVRVVTYGDQHTRRDPWVAAVVSRDGDIPTRYWRYARALHKAIKQQKPDVIFAQGPVSEGVPVAFVSRWTGIPVIQKVVGDYAWEQYQQSTKDPVLLDQFLAKRHDGKVGMMEDAERWTSRRAKHLIVPSDYLKYVAKQWLVPAEKITVIQNTVEPLPKPDKTEAVIRQQYGLEQKTILFTIGRAVPWKRWDFLLNILEELPESFHLVCAGDGPMLQAWQQQAKVLGLETRVTFTGRQSRQEIANWLLASQLFLLPSLYEGFPHVIAEAASVGLSSLVVNTTGSADMPNVFPGLVTALPADDLQAWKHAVQSQPFTRQTPTIHSPERMMHAYINLLTSSL